MANVTIDNLSPPASVEGGDLFETSKSGISGSATSDQVKDFVSSETNIKRSFWGNYDDGATSVTPLSVPASTWTSIPSDGAGGFTILDELPAGYSLYDTTNSYIDLSDVTSNSVVMIRADFVVETSTNNVGLKYRLYFDGDIQVFLTKRLPRLDEGATTYNIVEETTIFAGAATKNFPIRAQVFSTSSVDITVNGFFIHVIER
ncbi:MAG: hypothetical protein CML17_01965 [Pusillimonas sp.]|nr:hypothetical protein [Pusillimonas sp.]|tara:strand:+ start:3718 stop:4326 length:609 start_codon:yes stop_codon:yes gene_type:complete